MKKLFTFMFLLLGVVQSTYAQELSTLQSEDNTVLSQYRDNHQATDLETYQVDDTFVDNGITYKVTSTSPLEVQVGIGNWGSRAFSEDRVKEGVIVIPASVTGADGKIYTVTKVAYDAFSYCYGITEISIPKTITTIEDSFKGCSGLENFIVDEQNPKYRSQDGILYYIEGNKNVLLKCPAEKIIEDFIIPDGVTSVCDQAFNHYVKTISVPSSVSSISVYTFTMCEDLHKIVVDKNNKDLLSIDGVLFSNYIDSYTKRSDGIILKYYPRGRKDEEYSIPDGVIKVESRALFNKHLKSLIIPGSVKTIEDLGWPSLETIVVKNIFPPTLNSASWYNKNISLIVPSGTIDLYKSAKNWGDISTFLEKDMDDANTDLFDFYTRDNNTAIIKPKLDGIAGEVVIPEQVTIEGQTYKVTYMLAFSGCPYITDFFIPKTIETIEGGWMTVAGALTECPKLKNITVHEENSKFKSIDGVLFSKDGKYLYTYPGGKTDESYVIPDGVEKVESSAFYGNSFIKSITIPSSVKSFGYYVFGGSKNITSIILKHYDPDNIIYNEYLFNNETLENAVLYVPKGRASYYRANKGWGKFTHIEEMEMPDVEIPSSPFKNVGDNQMILGYYSSDEYRQDGLGGKNSGQYKFCIGFDKKMMKAYCGNRISYVRFALTDTEITDAKIWIASSRSGSTLYEQQVKSLVVGWNEVKLDTPFEIANDNLFIGLTYTQNNETYAMAYYNEYYRDLYYEYGCCYIYGPGIDGKYIWDDSQKYKLSIQCLIEGDNLPDYFIRTIKLLENDTNNKYCRSSISGTLYANNWGKNSIIDDIRLKCSIDGIFIESIEGVRYGTSENMHVYVNFPKNLEAGIHTLTVSVESINGKPLQHTDYATQELMFKSYNNDIGRQKNLLQLYTATWCPYSSSIKERVEENVKTGGFALVSSHIDDEFTCEAAKAYGAFTNYIPQIYFDRYAKNNLGYYYLSSETDRKQPSFATVNITASYSQALRSLHIKVTGNKNDDYDALMRDANLTVLLTEDKIIAPQFNIENYEHNGVLRTNVSAIWGDEIEWNGNQFEKSYNVKLDKKWVKDNMKIVAFIAQPFTGNNLEELHVTNCNDFALKDAILLKNETGDANGDGVIDNNDIDIISRYIMTGETDGFIFKNADTNGDGVVNVADIVAIIDMKE